MAQSDTEQQSLVQRPPEGAQKTVKKANIRPAKKRQLERRSVLHLYHCYNLIQPNNFRCKKALWYARYEEI